MVLITSDLGGITMAITSALSVGWLKVAQLCVCSAVLGKRGSRIASNSGESFFSQWVFFVIGVGYGISTFYNACQIYIESYYTMPAGKCKRLVVWMAIVFFSSWFMFPALFISGPEGTKALTWSGATIGALQGCPDLLHAL